MDANSYLLIAILLIIPGGFLLLGIALRSFIISRTKEFQEENSTITLESLNQSLITLHNNSSKVMSDIETFRDPMTSLNRYLSGGAKAGAVGEWGLEAIVSEILPSNQYEKDFMVNPEANDRVEFAIRMPEGLYMPIDSKFHSSHIDRYEAYFKASQKGEEGKSLLEPLKKEILDNIKTDAHDINTKYMLEGVTVDVGIMFIMSESFNQLIDSPDFRKKNKNISIREEIFNDYRVLIMGPNSFAAYLTSAYMGFRTLAINDQAKEIFKDIGKAKKEFNAFSKQTTQLIKLAENMLNKAKAQGVRERAMSKVLDNIDNPEKNNS